MLLIIYSCFSHAVAVVVSVAHAAQGHAVESVNGIVAKTGCGNKIETGAGPDTGIVTGIGTIMIAVAAVVATETGIIIGTDTEG